MDAGPDLTELNQPEAEKMSLGSEAYAAESEEDGPPKEIVQVSMDRGDELADGVREVIAPPGKLGIVVDTSLEGPVVNQILPTSPLRDSLEVGDVLLAINGHDTRAMEGSEITDMMIKTANENRILHVQSGR